MRNGDWIQTYTGIKFYPLDPRPEEVCIEDIAHALSNQCRFTGHTNRFYSVAEHSVFVSLCCRLEDAVWGLLHDAAEAYLCDVARPIKYDHRMAAYRQAELVLRDVIMQSFCLTTREPASVKMADQRMLATEARDLLGGNFLDDWKLAYDWYPDWRIKAWSPEMSKRQFMNRFRKLMVRKQVGGATVA